MEILILLVMVVIFRGTCMSHYQRMVRRQEKEAQKNYLRDIKNSQAWVHQR